MLISTTDTGFTGSREWVESVADLQHRNGRWVAIAKIPEETVACFMNINADELTASSDYVEIK